MLKPRALIGMVHVGALPGSPRGGTSVADLASRAAAEAGILAQAGFDAVLIENMHDTPYVHGTQGPEITAVMTRVGVAVKAVLGPIPLGVQILSGGNREAMAVALACGGSFIRCENFVFGHVADEGILERAEAGPLLRYRRSLGASIQVYCDVKKKHASHALTADLSLADCVEAAAFFGADGVIVTGSATGKPTSVEDVAEAKSAAGRLPVLVGSGVTPKQLKPLFAHADALIVGSWIKRGGNWRNPVDKGRARELVAEAARLRGGSSKSRKR